MNGLEFELWRQNGSGFSLEAEAEDELPWARVMPRADGEWRWEAGSEDEWRTPLGFASGKASTASEAKAAAEAWLRDS
ncbi:Uncharacterised protein (plasmid) [Tsukamurella tyrosinosolvens]|uniref:Uncharacterized protein n=1 Tax=Tsukamurella tyrosinosolvens TaxID=57704 RepID=A0A1H4V8H1_TSUTY|nr:hypothetical protein [Tsukamurella tyrosinosolvens]KXO91035.1 hypothetical protein AXK58_21635 [Tsukamurella tyrosinosolvens]SEC76704.1 hypothetical protein SAMN04489793_3160 [Tsukamurella tyrosinosolvens]VEH90652.1 Uncharacterised protein [Tsukamurella tyrosinosolvens]